MEEVLDDRSVVLVFVWDLGVFGVGGWVSIEVHKSKHCSFWGSGGGGGAGWASMGYFCIGVRQYFGIVVMELLFWN